jgi:hypothetical protein
MSVTTPETFKISGGACASEAAAIQDSLVQAGLANTLSGTTITVTNTGLTGTGGLLKFDAMLRIARAANAAVTYVAAS